MLKSFSFLIFMRKKFGFSKKMPYLCIIKRTIKQKRNMEFKTNPHSKKSLYDLKNEFEEKERKQYEEYLKKQKEFDKKYGFESRSEIVDYLRGGNLIGDFYGICGETSMSNNFIFYDDLCDEFCHHMQLSEDDCNFWMGNHYLSYEDLDEWLNRLKKTGEGFYPTTLFHKNFKYTRKDVYKLFVEIDNIKKSKTIENGK